MAGSGGDAMLRFVPPGSGTYVLAVAGHSTTGEALPNSVAVTVAAVPEPPVYLLLGSGFGWIVLRRVRRAPAPSRF